MESAFVTLPFVQWWIPDPNNPGDTVMIGGATVSNAPTMNSGDQIGMYCAYVPVRDGSIWGAVSYVFPGGDVPTSINLMIQPKQPAPTPGATIEWILENESATDGTPPNAVIPVFSGSPDSITPVTFVGAMGYGQSEGVTTPSTFFPVNNNMFNLFLEFILLLFLPDGLPGDPVNGFTVLWGNVNGQPFDAASVTLDANTVSFLYTGPS
jgi:hypothetical protein